MLFMKRWQDMQISKRIASVVVGGASRAIPQICVAGVIAGGLLPVSTNQAGRKSPDCIMPVYPATVRWQFGGPYSGKSFQMLTVP